MHFVILNFVQITFEPNINNIIYRLGMPFLIMPLVILVTILLRKIPGVKKIVP